MILRSTHYRSGFNASEGPKYLLGRCKTQSIKIFPERKIELVYSVQWMCMKRS